MTNVYIPIKRLFQFVIQVFIHDTRDLEGRRMRIAQIYVCVLLYFLLKAAAFDVHPSYKNGGKIQVLSSLP